jgi:putative ABC transport system permease protein
MPDWKQHVREHLPPLRIAGAREQEVIEELAQQLEDCYAEALARGASEKEATGRAAAQFPDWSAVAREIDRAEQPIVQQIAARTPESWQRALAEDSLRTKRGGNMFADFLQDVRYAFRMLRASPGFTAVAILTLALGIGVNTAIFSAVNAVLLRPLPYREPDRLVRLYESNESHGWPQFSVSPPNFMDWQQQNKSFEGISSVRFSTFNYTGGSEPERLTGARVNAPFFDLLGVKPLLGRTFAPREDPVGFAQVTVLSYGLWQRLFGGDASVVGRSVTLDGRPYTVIGVAPRGFQYPGRSELWVPSEFNARALAPTARGAHYIGVLARLKSGVTLGQAQQEMSAIAARMAQQFPNSNAGWDARVKSLNETIVGDIRQTLLVLLGAVGFVLLIVCANVANLLLARATARAKEMAVRTSLGASPGRIVRQLLTESVVLGALGSVFGIVLARWGIHALQSLPPGTMPRSDTVTLDLSVLAFTVLLTLFAGIVSGLIPALHTTRIALADTLKEGGRSATGGRARHRVRSALLVIEVTLAIMLLAGAGLMIRSFERLHRVDPGLRSENLLTAIVSLPQSKYADSPQVAQFFTQLIERLQALPGVEAAGVATSNPVRGDGYTFAFATKELISFDPSQQPSASYYAVSPDYFRAAGILLLQGRTFTAADAAGAPRVAIISQSLARKFFKDRNPIGQPIFIGAGAPTKEPLWREIVGVVGDVKDDGLDSAGSAANYEPSAQNPFSGMTIFLRTKGDPLQYAAALRSQVYAVDKDQPVASIATGEQWLADSVSEPHLRTILLGIFAGLALALAAIGLYGVMSYTVTQRTQEIGVRMAMGAQRRDIYQLVVGQGMILVVVGAVLGLGGALALNRLIKGFLFEVKATDPATYIAVSLLLVGVAAVACFIPARRASRVDPLIALRHE